MIGLKHSYGTSVVTFDVSGEQPVMLGYDYGAAYTGQPVVPELTTARWELLNGVWVLEQVTVTGSVIRKNGTPGVNRTTRIAYSNRNRAQEYRWTDDTPQWLRDAVESHDPQVGRTP
jgi:hypothetical protein